MPDEPVPDDAAGLRAANARLRAVVESQAAEIGGCGRAGCRPGADPAARAAFADPSVGAHAGVVSCGPGLNAAAVMLTAYGNVPPERTARVIGMILGTEVSAGWVGKASGRLSAQLGRPGSTRPCSPPWPLKATAPSGGRIREKIRGGGATPLLAGGGGPLWCWACRDWRVAG